MQLRLVVPPDWPVREVDGQRVAAVAPGVVLAWGWLVPFPDAPNAWVYDAMHADVGVGATVEPGTGESRRTRGGWSFKLIDANVVIDGRVVEWRLGAFYELFEYGAVALVRANDPEALRAVKSRLVDVLETATPDWQADG